MIIAGIGIALSLAIGMQTADLTVAGQNDFLPFYVGAREAWGGNLYDTKPYYAFIRNQFSAHNEMLIYIRPPYYALLLKPLSWLDYQTAHFVWIGLRLAAIGVFIWLWRRPTRADATMMTCVSLPLSMSIMTGQDVAFLLAAIAAAILLENQGRGFWAGAVLSLCSIKFHLFLLLPVLLLTQRRKDIAGGLGAGAACQILLSFASAGPRWPIDYYLVLAMDRINPRFDHTPSLHGLLNGIAGAFWIEAALALVIVVACSMIFRSSSFEVGLSVALVGGLLMSYHSYAPDAVVLLPSFLVLMDRISSRVLKAGMMVLLFPPAWLILLGDRPMPYITQFAILAVFTGVAWSLIASANLPRLAHSGPRSLFRLERKPLRRLPG